MGEMSAFNQPCYDLLLSAVPDNDRSSVPFWTSATRNLAADLSHVKRIRRKQTFSTILSEQGNLREAMISLPRDMHVWIAKKYTYSLIQ